MSATLERLWIPQEIAEYYRLDIGSVYRIIRQRTDVPVIAIGNTYRIPQSSVEQMFQLSTRRLKKSSKI